MRVLHVYAGNLFGGIETMLVALARWRHAAPGVEHEFALTHEGRLSRELRAAGAAVHPVGTVRHSRPWTVFRGRGRLRRLLRHGRYDVAVCHAAWSLTTFGPAVRRASVPLVFWQHDLATGEGRSEARARRTVPDLAICNSRFTRSTLPFLFPHVRAEVVYCPVAPPETDVPPDRAAVRAEMATAPGDVVIVQASRMEAWKGHALHLDALARLRGVPGWTCWMAGGAQRPHEAEYIARLRRLAADRGIGDRVRFPGDRADVPRLLAAADVLCQPNRDPEPFGITFVEALYAGLPVVSVHQGGVTEIVDATCGVLAPPGDADALAATLRCLVEDAGLRAKLGAAGPARARALCDPPAQARRIAEVLASAVPEGSRSA